MNRLIRLLALAICITLGAIRSVGAAPKDDGAEKAKSSKGLTVAVLDFEASTPGSPDLGKQIGEALTAVLSGEEGFTLVERSSLARILQENEINGTGLVTAEQSTKIGKLVGAKILISGKVFPLDKQLFFTAKLIGTETSLVDGVLVKGDSDADVGELMMKLAAKVATRLRERGPKLVAGADPIEDPLPALKKSLAGRKLPKVAVHIQEHHISASPPARIDPAVETEVSMILKEAGFTIIDGDDKELAKAGVTVIVGGEAFSEFAARIGNLVSCSARVEIKITDRNTDEVLYSDRETARGVDLAENLAAKSALQKAAHLLGIRILHHFDESLPAVDAGPDGKEKPPKKKPKDGE